MVVAARTTFLTIAVVAAVVFPAARRPAHGRSTRLRVGGARGPAALRGLPARRLRDERLSYPVVYFLHGLPASSTSYGSLHFVERALDGSGSLRSSSSRRGRGRASAIPIRRPRGRRRLGHRDHRELRGWSTPLPHDRQPGGRALVGVSAGGYGAMHLALGHLDEFSVVESWKLLPSDRTRAARSAESRLRRRDARPTSTSSSLRPGPVSRCSRPTSPSTSVA